MRRNNKKFVLRKCGKCGKQFWDIGFFEIFCIECMNKYRPSPSYVQKTNKIIREENKIIA